MSGSFDRLAPVGGMLLFDKPQGWTSHDAVAVVRRMLPRGTTVGHTGTLDPLATGLLVILAGPCTRLQSRLQGWDKVYTGTIRLGTATDTGDITGKVVETKEIPALTLAALSEVLASFRGTLEMPAPAYSAVKHQGKALYKYARQGAEVPTKMRTSVVHSWEAVAYDAPELTHRLACSSGTYVRSLAEAAGKRLGCVATVSSLRRDRVGPLEASEAMTFEQLKAETQAGLKARLAASLPSLEKALKARPYGAPARP